MKKQIGKPKWERAVSRKFYEALCRQIRSVSALSDDIDVSNMVRYVDEYIDHGSVKSEFSEIETVVFALLRPQIDKARERSQRARSAAARRREAKPSEEVNIPKPAIKKSKITRKHAHRLLKDLKDLKGLKELENFKSFRAGKVSGVRSRPGQAAPTLSPDSSAAWKR